MAPTLIGLVPNTCALGEADFTVSVQGTGFDAESVIVWGGADEPTTFVSETEVTTLVKPSVVTAPTTLPVLVRNGLGEESNALDFTWTAAVEPPSPDPARRPTITPAIRNCRRRAASPRTAGRCSSSRRPTPS